MNGLRNLVQALETGAGEIRVDSAIALRARRSIGRMLEFAAAKGMTVRSCGDLARDARLFGAAGPA